MRYVSILLLSTAFPGLLLLFSTQRTSAQASPGLRTTVETSDTTAVCHAFIRLLMESERTHWSYVRAGRIFMDAAALHGLHTEMLAHLKQHRGYYKDMGITSAGMDSIAAHIEGWNSAFEMHMDIAQKSFGKVIPDSVTFAFETGRHRSGIPKKVAHRMITKCLCGDPARLEHNGHTYALVGIGDQCWFAENLRTALFANGDTIPNITTNKTWKNLSTGAWAHYGNDSASAIPYGKLYNGYAVTAEEGLCPPGWHVPNDKEWFAMLNSVDPTVDDPTAISLIGWHAGGRMKAKGTQRWERPNLGATDESGFSGLPGGQLGHAGTFDDLTVKGHWWSAAQRNSKEGWYYALTANSVYPMKESAAKFRGFSVRCVKD